MINALETITGQEVNTRKITFVTRKCFTLTISVLCPKIYVFNWCVDDVEKECQDELEASGLTFEQVKKPLGIKARAWYLNECKTR